jgi:TolB protein
MPILTTENFPHLIRDFKISPDRTKVAVVTMSSDFKSKIFVMDRDGGGLTQIFDTQMVIFDPVWSPNNLNIAFTGIDPVNNNADIYTLEIDGGNLSRITDHPAIDYRPTWSPDGNQIAFVSDRTGTRQIFVASVEGSSLKAVTDFGNLHAELPIWSPR